MTGLSVFLIIAGAVMVFLGGLFLFWVIKSAVALYRGLNG